MSTKSVHTQFDNLGRHYESDAFVSYYRIGALSHYCVCMCCCCTQLSFLESIFLPLIEQIRLGGTQVDNFRTPVSILLLLDAFSTVVGIRHARPPAHHTPALQTAIIAFLADFDAFLWIDEGIANDAVAVAFVSYIIILYNNFQCFIYLFICMSWREN